MTVARLTSVGAAIVFAMVGATNAEHHWSYSGETGPSHWGSLERDFAVCGQGRAQSPINIETTSVRHERLPPLQFDYKPSPLRIIDNGHTILVSVQPGSFLTVGKDRFELVQFHFHHPSEERIDGRTSAMVAHLVHRDAAGHLAVVAILLEPGSENPLISTLWHNLPREKGREKAPAGIVIDVSRLLPAARGYYSYSGSLTTPPCTEGVRWFVLKSPTPISARQIAIFSNIYAANARMIEPLNGRQVRANE